MDTMTIIVCTYENEKYAGMDHASGGYPYAVDNIFQAYQWQGKPEKDLKRYVEMFPELTPIALKVEISKLETS